LEFGTLSTLTKIFNWINKKLNFFTRLFFPISSVIVVTLDGVFNAVGSVFAVVAVEAQNIFGKKFLSTSKSQSSK